MTILAAAVLLVLSPGLLSAEGDHEAPKPVCATDFESADAWGLYKRLVREELLEVRDGQGAQGSKALRATYRGNKQGSERISLGFELPRKMDEATLVFDVKFDEGFQFVKGGKLLGFGPDKHITGGHAMRPEGWSARAMWRPNGVSSYVYCQNKSGRYGRSPKRMVEQPFETGRYYALSYYVKLNDPVDRANGVMRVYVDGKLVSEDRKIQFRSVDGENTKITALLFSTFHGGDDPSWAPKDEQGNYTDVYAYFDNLAVYEGLQVRKQPGMAEPKAAEHD